MILLCDIIVIVGVVIVTVGVVIVIVGVCVDVGVDAVANSFFSACTFLSMSISTSMSPLSFDLN